MDEDLKSLIDGERQSAEWYADQAFERRGKPGVTDLGFKVGMTQAAHHARLVLALEELAMLRAKAMDAHYIMRTLSNGVGFCSCGATYEGGICPMIEAKFQLLGRGPTRR